MSLSGAAHVCRTETDPRAADLMPAFDRDFTSEHHPQEWKLSIHKVASRRSRYCRRSFTEAAPNA